MRIGLLPPDLSGTSIDQAISMEEVLRNAHRICQIFKLPIFAINQLEVISMPLNKAFQLPHSVAQHA